MNKVNHIEASSSKSKKSKHPEAVTKRKRIDNDEVSDRTYSNPESVNKRKRIDNDEISDRSTLEKILRQNTKIISKLESLDAKVSKIEEICKNNINNDAEFVKNIVKEIAPKLLETSIYPNSDEFREATSAFINENHKEFMNKFKRPDNWVIYYENYIAAPLLEKHRSVRGVFSGKIKSVMSVTFRELHLPPIPTSSSETKIKKWKKEPAVKSCYDKLFKKINSSEPETYISRIIQALSKGKKPISNIQIAFAISVCELVLNPKNLDIQISEIVIKPILTKNLKKIRENENFYLHEEEDERGEEEEKEKDERGKEEEKKKDEREEEEEEVRDENKEKERNEGEENEEEDDGIISYQSSSDEEIKGRLGKLRKQYKG